MVKVIVATSKHDCEHLLGQFVDESNFDILIEEDTDCFMEPKNLSQKTSNEVSEERIAFLLSRNRTGRMKVFAKLLLNLRTVVSLLVLVEICWQ